MKWFVVLSIVAPLFAGCATTHELRPRSDGNVLHGDAAHPDVAANWVRTELYFGLGVISDKGEERDAVANEKRWRDFLDREITARFPDGLSVYDIYGQWRTQDHSDIERLHSKEVMLLYADTPAHRADIEAIRSAWKKATGDLSVLRVTQPADVSF